MFHASLFYCYYMKILNINIISQREIKNMQEEHNGDKTLRFSPLMLLFALLILFIYFYLINYDVGRVGFFFWNL